MILRLSLYNFVIVEQLTLESVRIRLMGEVKTFVCVEEWDWTGMMQVKDFTELLPQAVLAVLSLFEGASAKMVTFRFFGQSPRDIGRHRQSRTFGQVNHHAKLRQ